MLFYFYNILSTSKADSIRQTATKKLTGAQSIQVGNSFEIWIPNYPTTCGKTLKTEPRPELKDFTGKSGFIRRLVFTPVFKTQGKGQKIKTYTVQGYSENCRMLKKQ